MSAILAFLAGALFSVGLVVSGMTKPAKVIAFLDVTGSWDPSLAFVMGGGVLVYALAWRLSRRLRAPAFAREFPSPTRTRVDARLVAGASLFGVGWGLAGYCPAPAITGLGSGVGATVIFVTAMFAGMYLHTLLDGLLQRRAAPVRVPE